MTDREIIIKLINRDELVTRQFFFKNCRPLFVNLIRKIFNYEVDYDEFVNELYLYLMENDAYRLKQFEGRSSIYQWLKIVAIRYFMSKKARMIENVSNDSLLSEAERTLKAKEDRAYARIDLYRLLKLMPNKRQVYVLKRLVWDDAEPEKVAEELNVTVDNLYNIKKRAITALIRVAINEEK